MPSPRRFRLPAALVLLILVVLSARAEETPDDSSLLFGKRFPVETHVAFHAGLLHWLDSLAGLSGAGFTSGKTRPAHRQEFSDRFGRPSPSDLEMLQRYSEARLHFARGVARERVDELTIAFFEADTLEQALNQAELLLEEPHISGFRSALLHYSERYRMIWDDGSRAVRFLERSRRGRLRKSLARFLVDVAGFYRVAPNASPYPRLILVPVESGWGTHAQAIGRYLLIEIRKGEGLIDEVAPIVHENAHFLFARVSEKNRLELMQAASQSGERAVEAWKVLQEALPTAIAQGVARERFDSSRFSPERGWYHTEAVDRYAKAIFPMVREQLSRRGQLDGPFMNRLIEAYEPITEATPRSP